MHILIKIKQTIRPDKNNNINKQPALTIYIKINNKHLNSK